MKIQKESKKKVISNSFYIKSKNEYFQPGYAAKYTG